MILLITFLVTIVTGIYFYYKWAHSHWKRKGLPFLEPSIPFGTMENPLVRKYSHGMRIKRMYDELKCRGLKHGGVYNFASPVYLPVDPEYVKNIMQRDFQYFTDRGVYYNEKEDPLSAHLFAIGGQKWRNLRTKLTPTFTSGKMKMMFDTLVQCSLPMGEALDNLHEKKEPVDIKETVARFTTDVIGSCAFGLECNSFKSPDAEFRKYGKMLFAPNKLRIMRPIFLLAAPQVGKLFKMRLLPKDLTDFFFNAVKQTVNYREANNVVRKDMLQLMIELMKNKEGLDRGEHDGKSLTIEEVAAQAFVFFAAGFETSSTTMTFCFYELATNQDIQDKVREEVNRVMKKHDGKLTYEGLAEMKYMEQVLEETLRKYPPAPSIPRRCVKDYKIPDTDVTIDKGTLVFIPILGLHRDPEYYPDPEKFDPERFSDENKKERHQFTYIPFGEGPRICIGLRFGMMQAKVGLAVLLKNYKFTLNKKTEVPLKINRYSLVLSTDQTIWLDTEKI